MTTHNRIPGTNCYRGLIDLTRDGSLYGTRIMDAYDCDTKEWVCTVGGRNVTTDELDAMVALVEERHERLGRR